MCSRLLLLFGENIFVKCIKSNFFPCKKSFFIVTSIYPAQEYLIAEFNQEKVNFTSYSLLFSR